MTDKVRLEHDNGDSRTVFDLPGETDPWIERGYRIVDESDDDSNDGEPNGSSELAEATIDELRAFAQTHNIDLGDATSEDEIRAVIDAALNQGDDR
ncbi:MAG: hypothetical protein AAF567_24510 [Actinomycetota bacterium]